MSQYPADPAQAILDRIRTKPRPAPIPRVNPQADAFFQPYTPPTQPAQPVDAVSFAPRPQQDQGPSLAEGLNENARMQALADRAGFLGQTSATARVAGAEAIDQSTANVERLMDVYRANAVPPGRLPQVAVPKLPPSTVGAEMFGVTDETRGVAQRAGFVPRMIGGAIDVAAPLLDPVSMGVGSVTKGVMSKTAGGGKDILAAVERLAGKPAAQAVHQITAPAGHLGTFMGLNAAASYPNWAEDPAGGIKAVEEAVQAGMVTGATMGAAGAAGAGLKGIQTQRTAQKRQQGAQAGQDYARAMQRGHRASENGTPQTGSTGLGVGYPKDSTYDTFQPGEPQTGQVRTPPLLYSPEGTPTRIVSRGLERAIIRDNKGTRPISIEELSAYTETQPEPVTRRVTATDSATPKVASGKPYKTAADFDASADGPDAMGGISSLVAKRGLKPAFRDAETGKVYPSQYPPNYANEGDPARPAPIHVIDGLPDEVVIERDRHPDAKPWEAPTAEKIKATVEAGFVDESGKFHTRKEVAPKKEPPNVPQPSDVAKRPVLSEPDTALRPGWSLEHRSDSGSVYYKHDASGEIVRVSDHYVPDDESARGPRRSQFQPWGYEAVSRNPKVGDVHRLMDKVEREQESENVPQPEEAARQEVPPIGRQETQAQQARPPAGDARRGQAGPEAQADVLSGPARPIKSKPYTRKDLEQTLVTRHRDMTGEGVMERQDEDGVTARDKGGARTFFNPNAPADGSKLTRTQRWGLLPSEIREKFTPAEAEAAGFQVTNQRGQAGGEQTAYDVGWNEYIDAAKGEAVEGTKAAKDFLRGNQMDPEAGFLSALHDILPRKGRQLASADPMDLQDGDSFTIAGKKATVTKTDQGLVLKAEGLPETPIDALSRVPMDKGSLRGKPAGGPKRTRAELVEELRRTFENAGREEVDATIAITDAFIAARGWDPDEGWGRMISRVTTDKPKGKGALYQDPKAPVFYSKLRQLVEEKMGGSMDAQALQAMLRNNGAKPEEMEWARLEGLSGKLTRKQVLEHLDENAVKVEEFEKGDKKDYQKAMGRVKAAENVRQVTLGVLKSALRDDAGIRPTQMREWLDEIVEGRTPAAMRETIEQIPTVRAALDSFREASAIMKAEDDKAHSIGQRGDVKFQNYQLPGGENYRELLLTMPESGEYKLPPGYKIVEQAKRGSDEMEYFLQKPDGSGNRLHSDSMYGAKSEAKGFLEREGVLKRTQPFTASHWDEPNVLAHIRFNDRTIDGKKVLFIEEIQSDWHQKGREQGYNTPVEPKLREGWKVERLDAEGAEAFGVKEGEWVLLDESGNDVLVLGAHPDERAAIRAATEAADDAGVAGELGIQTGKGVPNAPFKKSWHELAMKRMIRYAAENGYDRVAWTPGDVQNERYDLSKQIQSIRVSQLPGGHLKGHFALQAKDMGGRVVLDDAYPAEKLPDVVGKDMARKIVSDAEQARLQDPDARQEKTYSGLDLKVGGEGMRGFYDDILPKATDKIIKKWGAKVADEPLQTGPGGKAKAPDVRDFTQDDGESYGGAENFKNGKPPMIADVRATVNGNTGNFVAILDRDGITIIDSNLGEEFKASWPVGLRRNIGQTNAISLFKAMIEAPTSTMRHAFRERSSGLAATIDFPDTLSTVQAHGFDITPSMREEALGKGLPLFQRQGKDKRGAVSFEADGRAIIHALTDPDASTPAHEMGHIFRRHLPEDELGIVESHYGIKDKKWDRPSEERYATDLERYLAEGKAPTPELQPVFEKFKQWLTAIYRAIVGTPLEKQLTPEMREHFARILTPRNASELKARIKEKTDGIPVNRIDAADPSTPPADGMAGPDTARPADPARDRGTPDVPEPVARVPARDDAAGAKPPAGRPEGVDVSEPDTIALKKSDDQPPAEVEAIDSDGNRKTIGLNKAEIRSLREAYQLHELTKPERRAVLTSYADAKARDFDRNAVALAKSAIENRTIVDDTLHAGFATKAVELANSLDAHAAKAKAAEEAGDDIGAAMARAKYQEALTDLDTLTVASERSGTGAARSMNIRKYLLDRESFEIAPMLARARKVKRDKISTEEADRIAFASKNYLQIQKDLEDMTKRWRRSEDQRAKDLASGIVKQAARQGPTGRGPGMRILRQRAKLHTERADLWKKLQGMGMRINDLTGVGPDAIYILGRLALNYARDGAITLPEIVAKMREKAPDLTEQDIVRAIAMKDPKAQKRAKMEATKRVAAIKAQASLMARIDDLVNGIAPPDGSKPTASPEIKALQKQLADLREKNRLESTLATGAKPAPKGQRTPRSPEVEALRGKLRDKREEARLESAIEKAKAGQTSKKTPPAQRTEAINKLRGELKELRKAASKIIGESTRLEKAQQKLDDMEALLKAHARPLKKQTNDPAPPLADIQKRMRDIKREMRLDDTLADLQGQIDRGDFKVTVRPPEIMPPEIEAKQVALRKAKIEARRTIEDMRPWDAGRYAGEIWNTMRTLKTTIDISGTFRQGAVFVSRMPREGIRAQKEALRSMASEDYAHTVQARLMAEPRQLDRDLSGLILSEIDGSPNAREEVFNSNWAQQVWGYGRLVKASERHMAVDLNILRAAMFDSFKDLHPNATRVELKAWAEAVNAAGGKSEWARGLGWIGKAFLAPGFTASRIQFPLLALKHTRVGAAFRRQFLKQSDAIALPRVRNEILKTYAAYLFPRIAILALAHAAGASVNWTDPREADWLKIRIGNRRIDIWGGILQPVRMVVRGALGVKDAQTGEGRNMLAGDLIKTFSEQRLHPALQFLHEMVYKRNMIGQETNRWGTLARVPAPITADQIVQDYRQAEPGYKALNALFTTILDATGLGTQVYPDSEATTRREIKRLREEGGAVEAEERRKEWNARNPTNKIAPNK